MIFDCLFGLYVSSHQSCAAGTLLPPKDIYPRKCRQIFTDLFFNACISVAKLAGMPQNKYGQRGKMCLFGHILTKSALKFRYCPMLPSRHCFGVVPVTFLNKVMKYDTSLMPQSMATSETGLSFCPLKISLAISILTRSPGRCCCHRSGP